MRVEHLKALLVTAEEMLATASTLPEGAGRNQAIQMIRDYILGIERLMSAMELGLRSGAS